jgi:hypothetical protein
VPSQYGLLFEFPHLQSIVTGFNVRGLPLASSIFSRSMTMYGLNLVNAIIGFFFSDIGTPGISVN